LLLLLLPLLLLLLLHPGQVAGRDA